VSFITNIFKNILIYLF